MGSASEVAAAAIQGAAAGVELCLGLTGVLCLWTGVLELMRRAGLTEKLSRLLRPLLGRLYPPFKKDEETMAALSANLSANLLGLGNAATPMGIRAACRMAEHSPGTASDSLCMLVVCNTASVQLIPATVAGARLAAGCATPFDILPAVWLTSLISVGTGICMAKVLGRIWKT